MLPLSLSVIIKAIFPFKYLYITKIKYDYLSSNKKKQREYFPEDDFFQKTRGRKGCSLHNNF